MRTHEERLTRELERRCNASRLRGDFDMTRCMAGIIVRSGSNRVDDRPGEVFSKRVRRVIQADAVSIDRLSR